MICQKSIFRLEGVLPNFWQNQAWFDQNVCRWAILLLWLLSIQETTTFQKTERIIPSTKGTLRLNLGEADERNLKQSSNNINDNGNKAIFFAFYCILRNILLFYCILRNILDCILRNYYETVFILQNKNSLQSVLHRIY